MYLMDMLLSRLETHEYRALYEACVLTVMVIPEMDVHDLSKGFSYPPMLAKLRIPGPEWAELGPRLTFNGPNNVIGATSMAYHVEQVLDTVAIIDQSYFRPRGLIMRLDMPGEEKYGLYFMDIYHYKKKGDHVDNALAMATALENQTANGSQKYKETIQKESKVTAHTNKFVRATAVNVRLVFDSMNVLRDPVLAAHRGEFPCISVCHVPY